AANENPVVVHSWSPSPKAFVSFRAKGPGTMAEMQDGPWGEYRAWLQGTETGEYYEHLLHDATTAPARNAARSKVVKPTGQPWENAPHGLIKHLVNEEMNTRVDTLD